MRDFNFKDDDIAVGRPLNELPQTPRIDETILQDESEPMRPFHAAVNDEESGNGTAKIVGGVVVGLLIIGGGIYAYETFSPSKPAQQTVAMKTPTPNSLAKAQPANPPAVAPPATAPDTTAAPSQTSPDGISTTPSRTARSSNGTAAPPAATADDTIEAPMTLTPENAPPPQQSAPAGQTAMQQPITGPTVATQTSGPQAELANKSADVPTSDLSPATNPPAQTAAAPEQVPAQQPSTPAQ